MHLTSRERRFIHMMPLERISADKRQKHAAAARAEFQAFKDLSERKGKLHGKCNRTACGERGEDVRWWNRVTHAFYCTSCKRSISEFDDDCGGMGSLFDPVPHEAKESAIAP
jgi:hypothetical protein